MQSPYLLWISPNMLPFDDESISLSSIFGTELGPMPLSMSPVSGAMGLKSDPSDVFADTNHTRSDTAYHCSILSYDDDVVDAGYSSLNSCEVPTTPPLKLASQDESHLWFNLNVEDVDTTDYPSDYSNGDGPALVPDLGIDITPSDNTVQGSSLDSTWVSRSSPAKTKKKVGRKSKNELHVSSTEQRSSLSVSLNDARSTAGKRSTQKKTSASLGYRMSSTSGSDSPPHVPSHAPSPTRHRRRKAASEPKKHSRSSAATKGPRTKACGKNTTSESKRRASTTHVKQESYDQESSLQNPAMEKRRKMEGNRRAAKKFRMKQKLKEQELQQHVLELEERIALTLKTLEIIDQVKHSGI